MSHIFISYSKLNKEYADALKNFLQEQGFDVWIDDRIDTGDRWWKVIAKAIRECNAFLVVMTPEAYESEWVENECMLARQLKKPVFPLLLSGENWDLFVSIQFHDVTGGSMPKDDFLRCVGKYTAQGAKSGS